MNATAATLDTLAAAELGALADGLADTRDRALELGTADADALAVSNNEQWLLVLQRGRDRFGADWLNARFTSR